MSWKEPTPPPSLRSMRWVLYSMRWFTIFASIAVGFGFLVWKTARRPLSLRVAFLMPAHSHYELFAAGRSMGHSTVVLDEELLRDLSDQELEALAWPPSGLEQAGTDQIRGSGFSIDWGFVGLPEGSRVLHIRMDQRGKTLRRAVRFQAYDGDGRELTTWKGSGAVWGRNDGDPFFHDPFFQLEIIYP